MIDHTMPTFRHVPPTGLDPFIRRHDAAARLMLSYERLVKLIRVGVIPDPIPRDLIDSLAHRPFLAVDTGEMTVLRTDARIPGRQVGVHVSDDNTELAETGLGWWRSDAEKIVRLGLFAATVSTFPVALWDIGTLVESLGTRTDRRHRFDGDLLARLRPAGAPVPDDERIEFGIVEEATVVTVPRSLQRDDPRHAAALAVMTSRIKVESGGPIGYLTPTAAMEGVQ